VYIVRYTIITIYIIIIVLIAVPEILYIQGSMKQKDLTDEKLIPITSRVKKSMKIIWIIIIGDFDVEVFKVWSEISKLFGLIIS